MDLFTNYLIIMYHQICSAKASFFLLHNYVWIQHYFVSCIAWGVLDAKAILSLSVRIICNLKKHEKNKDFEVSKGIFKVLLVYNLAVEVSKVF